MGEVKPGCVVNVHIVNHCHLMFKEVLFKPIYFGVTKSTSKVIAKLINHAKMAIVVLNCQFFDQGKEESS